MPSAPLPAPETSVGMLGKEARIRALYFFRNGHNSPRHPYHCAEILRHEFSCADRFSCLHSFAPSFAALPDPVFSVRLTLPRIAIAWYGGASGEQLKRLYYKLYTDAFR